MSRSLLWIFSLYLSFVIVLGLDAAETMTDDTIPDKLIIAYNVSNPPLKFKDKNETAAGILIDLWRLWSKKTGISVEFREALFEETIQMVSTGEADLHAGLFYTKEPVLQ